MKVLSQTYAPLIKFLEIMNKKRDMVYEVGSVDMSPKSQGSSQMQLGSPKRLATKSLDMVKSKVPSQ